MKQCTNEIKENIALYYDGILSEAEIAEIDAHVENCETCREELEIYRYLHQEMQLDDLPLPSDFHEDLMSRIKNETPSRKVVSKYYRFSPYANLAATFVLVILLSLIGFLQNAQDADKSASIAERTTEARTNEAISSQMTTAEAPTEESFALDRVTNDTSELTTESITESTTESTSESTTAMTVESATMESAEFGLASEADVSMKAEAEIGLTVEIDQAETENTLEQDKGDQTGWMPFIVLTSLLIALLIFVTIRIFYFKKKRE